MKVRRANAAAGLPRPRRGPAQPVWRSGSAAARRQRSKLQIALAQHKETVTDSVPARPGTLTERPGQKLTRDIMIPGPRARGAASSCSSRCGLARAGRPGSGDSRSLSIQVTLASTRRHCIAVSSYSSAARPIISWRPCPRVRRAQEARSVVPSGHARRYSSFYSLAAWPGPGQCQRHAAGDELQACSQRPARGARPFW